MDTLSILADARDHEPLIDRALAAYFRSAAREGATSPDMPANDSYLCEFDGKRYVVLHNINGVLDVYRVRNDGVLRRMKRWPREVAPREGE